MVRSKRSNYPLVRILKNSYFRKVLILLAIVFSAVEVLYTGIAFNAAAIPGSLYLNHAINGMLEGKKIKTFFNSHAVGMAVAGTYYTVIETIGKTGTL